MQGRQKRVAVESSDEMLQAARPQHDLAASPCAACPVRPLSICSGLSIDELTDLEKIVTSVVVKTGAPIFDDPAIFTKATAKNPDQISGCIDVR